MQIKVKVVAPFDGKEELSDEIMILDVPKMQSRQSVEKLVGAMRDKFQLLDFRIVQIGLKQFNVIGEPKPLQ
jgi:hypothetical protein